MMTGKGKAYEIEATFLEPMLGTVPKDKEIYDKYIKSKAPQPEGEEVKQETETVPGEEDAVLGWTTFHEDGEGKFIYNYMIKGFLKAACGFLRRVPDTSSKKLTSYKKVIDGLVFVKPRKIRFNLNGGEIEVLDRFLRAETPKGPRVAPTRADIVPAGTTINFTIHVFGAVSKKLLIEWLDHGQWTGLGQWRNAEYGSFSYKILSVQ